MNRCVSRIALKNEGARSHCEVLVLLDQLRRRNPVRHFVRRQAIGAQFILSVFRYFHRAFDNEGTYLIKKRTQRMIISRPAMRERQRECKAKTRESMRLRPM